MGDKDDSSQTSSRYQSLSCTRLTYSRRSTTDGTRLVELASAADVEFFKTPEGDAYAAIEVGRHRETLALRSESFGHWLRQRFYWKYQRSAGRNALGDAVDNLVARAHFEGQERDVFLRARVLTLFAC